MKKKDLSNLICLGLAAALMSAAQAQTSPKATTDKDAPAKEDNDPAHGNAGYYLMTEEDLLLELNEEGTKNYNSLDAEGKALALKVASQRCGMTNLCKGLNACATDKNTCAGKGDCKGLGKCAFADKNLAVKVVLDKMAKKREDLTK